MLHITKKEQINNVMNELKSCINRNNVDIALPLLKWTIEKIKLSFKEKTRQKIYFNTHKKDGLPRFVKRGMIYYANLGKNIGSEQNGTGRPVLVVQNQSFNIASATVLVIPLTDYLDKDGNPKRLLDTHVEIEHELLEKKSIIKVEQLRSISKNRLKAQICHIGIKKMCEIDNKLRLTLGLTIDNIELNRIK